MATPQYSTSIDSGISKEANHLIPQNQVLPAPSTTPKPFKRVSPSVLAADDDRPLNSAGPGVAHVAANETPARDRNQVMPTLEPAELTPPPSPEYGAYAPPSSASGPLATSCADGSGGVSHTPSTQHHSSTANESPSQLHPIFTVGAVTSPEEEKNPLGATATTEMVTFKSVQDMKGQLAENDVTITSLKGRLAGSKSQNHILQQEFDKAKEQFEHKLKRKNDEVDKLKGEAEEYRVQLSNLEKKNEEDRVKHEGEIQCYENKLKQLEEKVESKEKEIDRMKDEFKYKELEHAKEKSDLEKDILKNEVKICKMETQEESLRRKLAVAEKKIAELETAKMKEENATIKDQNAIIKDENATIKEENATIKEENAAVRAELQRLQSMSSLTSSGSDASLKLQRTDSCM